MAVKDRSAPPADGGRTARATGACRMSRQAIWPTALTCAGLVALILVIYWQTLQFEFVNFDDDAHVTENVHVSTGLTSENVAWDFKIHGPSQWHPLAWLSHQADCTLFGLSPGRHHGTNLLLHAAAAVLLFLTLQRMTAAWGPAAFVAAAFAVHPLNVESVAWIAERRNVLCAMFWMLTLRAYAAYVRNPTWYRYGAVIVLHAAALMSKPLAVTLPCVLMLLDRWPLRRFWGESDLQAAPAPFPESAPVIPQHRVTGAKLVLEKVPLLALSAIACWLTILCQQSAGTIASVAAISFPMRLANAVAGYGWYLQKIVWPTGMACFYPHPALAEQAPWGRIAAPCAVSGVVLVVMTCLAVRRRNEPWLLTGWLWFLGVLVPMIGLVQVGEQQRADRYAYLPAIGLFLMAAWIGRRISQRLRGAHSVVLFTGFATLCGWGVVAHRQAMVWHDSLSLFAHALKVTDRNHWAHNNLGRALMQRGRKPEAAEQFAAAVEVAPTYALAHYNLGVALRDLGVKDASITHLELALKNDPTHSSAHQHLAAALAETGRFPEAIMHFQEAARLLPESGQAQFNLGLALSRAGRSGEGIDALEKARKLQPEDVPTLLALAAAYRAAGRLTDARSTLESLLSADPRIAEGHLLLGEILRDNGEIVAARRSLREACRLRPDWPRARAALENLPDR